jgi:hypothetical protein
MAVAVAVEFYTATLQLIPEHIHYLLEETAAVMVCRNGGQWLLLQALAETLYLPVSLLTAVAVAAFNLPIKAAQVAVAA